MTDLQWLSMADVIRIRRASTCDDARRIVLTQYPSRSAEECEEALRAIRKNDYTESTTFSGYVVEAPHDPYRGNFVAVVYMMGASLGQLAALLGIKRSTVYELVRRRMPVTVERNALRASRKLTYEGIGIIKNIFYSLMRTDECASKYPTMQVVALLEKELELDVDHVK